MEGRADKVETQDRSLKFWALLFVVPVFLILYGIYLGMSSPVEKAKVIRLGHGLSQGHPVHKGMEFLADDLYRRSDGTLRIDIYADGQLGPERENIEMLQMGSLGMTKVSTGPLENFSPKMSVFSLPYLFRDRDHYWNVLDGPIGEELLEVSVPFRLKGICFYDAGSRSFYLNQRMNRAVRRPEDLSGLNIRVMASKSAVRMVEVLGAKPVPIPFGELYSALDTGTVDGAENNPPSLHTSRQYEVSGTYTLNEHQSIPDILIMSVDTWERLTPQEQEWLMESAHASSLYQRKLWLESELESLAAMENAGLKIVKDVDREAFRRKAAAMYEDAEYQTREMRDLISRIQQTP